MDDNNIKNTDDLARNGVSTDDNGNDKRAVLYEKLSNLNLCLIAAWSIYSGTAVAVGDYGTGGLDLYIALGGLVIAFLALRLLPQGVKIKKESGRADVMVHTILLTLFSLCLPVVYVVMLMMEVNAGAA